MGQRESVKETALGSESGALRTENWLASEVKATGSAPQASTADHLLFPDYCPSDDLRKQRTAFLCWNWVTSSPRVLSTGLAAFPELWDTDMDRLHPTRDWDQPQVS